MSESTQVKYTRKDFTSDQAVRWCPGCGDYSILTQTQKVFPDLGRKKKNLYLFQELDVQADSLIICILMVFIPFMDALLRLHLV